MPARERPNPAYQRPTPAQRRALANAPIDATDATYSLNTIRACRNRGWLERREHDDTVTYELTDSGRAARDRA